MAKKRSGQHSEPAETSTPDLAEFSYAAGQAEDIIRALHWCHDLDPRGLIDSLRATARLVALTVEHARMHPAQLQKYMRTVARHAEALANALEALSPTARRYIRMRIARRLHAESPVPAVGIEDLRRFLPVLRDAAQAGTDLPEAHAYTRSSPKPGAEAAQEFVRGCAGIFTHYTGEPAKGHRPYGSDDYRRFMPFVRAVIVPTGLHDGGRSLASLVRTALRHS